MTDLDQIHINFSPDQLTLLNIVLAFILFGVALDLKPEDFKRVFSAPRSVLVGFFAQYLFLPVLTLGMIWVFNAPASLALGMILVAVCPGGNISNFMTHLARGNIALSVTLTSFTTLSAIILTPLTFSFWSSLVPQAQELRATIFVEPQQMFKTIFQLIFIPVVLGMGTKQLFPKVALWLYRPTRILSLAIFIVFIVVAIHGNWENIRTYLSDIFFLVFLYNGLAMASGYFLARLFKRPEVDARALTMETGIHNTGLGLILVFNFFNGLGGMAIMLAWWGIWDLISSFALGLWWNRNHPKEWSVERGA
ncbi:MAG: bile acid:sodium symporter family protein [Saprospirales bacterium]|nr:bile acid:sodium symporter family protein [Saprospirales bacterium]MBK8490801.1 bile acid:sodium symporter family protein [Saprospirales bacterium]